MNRSAAVLGILALFVVPLVPAQEADDDAYTHLYGHVYGFRRTEVMPMNTLFPYGEDDYSIGYGPGSFYNPMLPSGAITEIPLWGPVSACEGLPPDEWLVNCEPRYEVESNEVWFYSYNDGFSITTWTEYEALGGLEVLDGGRALLKNAQFDTSKPVLAEFYMAADATGVVVVQKPGEENPDLVLVGDGLGQTIEDTVPYWKDLPWPYPGWNVDYGVLPGWTLFSKAYSVPSTLMSNETGPGIPNVPDAILADETNVTVIAEGYSEPFDLYSLPSSVGEYQVVYGIPIDLGAPLVKSVPAGETLWWWVDWYSQLPDGSQVMVPENGFAVDSGEFFPPHLSLPMTNPMDIEMVMPQFTDDNKLVIIALFNSPFGAYDVPLDSASFEIIAPDGSVIATQDDDTVTWMQKAAREQQSLLGVSPEAALARGQATWLWNYLAEKDIKPGDYTIRVRAENQQGKAAFKEAYFTIAEGLGKGAVTSSLGGMFTFSKEDIKKLEECHGCHDAETGDLLEGVQNVTMAEAQQMMETSELDADQDEGTPKKKLPTLSVGILLAALVVLASRRR